MFSLLFPLVSLAMTVESERPADFVDASRLVPGLSVKMMYFGSENFVGRPIAGYKQNVCLLTRPAAEELARAELRLREIGEKDGRSLTLQARDCYRPQKATDDFVAWTKDDSSPGNKAEFFPNVDKPEILSAHYLSSASGHSRGSTIDLTIVETLKDSGEKELNMGTRVDFLGSESRTANPELTAEQRANRRLLGDVMGKNFENYSKEWWHFSLRHEPYPHTLFDFDVTSDPAAR